MARMEVTRWRNGRVRADRKLTVLQATTGTLQLISALFTFSHAVTSDPATPAAAGLRHARPPCPSPAPGVYSNSCPLSQWCQPAISSSVIPFSSRLQSFPASGSLSMSQFFTLGGQSIEISGSASVFPKNIQDWFALEWTGWISLLTFG